MEELLNLISENELPEPYSDIVHRIGIQNVIELAKMFGGSRVYFPKIESTTRPQRDEKIKSEYNQYNVRELARKYNLSENRVLQICKDIREKEKYKPLDGQISIFE
ncbi:hypothetical protein KQI38_09370 [Tissierella carlieri]|uniref:Mor transcription activator family protein n=1 Tax=Tissierella carlieri TaxID=689904 RepID=UPI001C1039E9|nr:hypothetical protein [Tissierella carlieri]